MGIAITYLENMEGVVFMSMILFLKNNRRPKAISITSFGFDGCESETKKRGCLSDSLSSYLRNYLLDILSFVFVVCVVNAERSGSDLDEALSLF